MRTVRAIECSGININKVIVRAPDRESSIISKPDYLLEDLGILIEVKEVHDRQDMETWIAWQKNIDRLKKEIKFRQRLFLTWKCLIYALKFGSFSGMLLIIN